MKWIYNFYEINMINATSGPSIVSYVDKHNAGQETEKHSVDEHKCWSRNKEAQPFTVEWTTTFDLPQSYYSGMISLNYE